MTQWFADGRDDDYLAWCAAHPDGFVVNTTIPPTPGYLILHRVSCRTIYRDLAPGKSWTRQYGKACAPTADELEAWAEELTGARPASCRTCGGDGVLQARSAGAPRATARRLGGTAGEGIVPPTFEGDSIRLRFERMDEGPALVFDGAQWLAEMFFKYDPSAVGYDSFDSWTIDNDKDRFVEDDVHALNRTMATRSSPGWWADLLGDQPSPILASLTKAWDLVETDDRTWIEDAVAERTAAALASMTAPHRGVAVNTKMLHLKRPRLVPVLDSLVIDQVGGRGRTVAEVLEHLRLAGRSNVAGLHRVQAHLQTLTGWDGRPIDRSIARIMDALLWSTHPASILYPRLRAWQVRFEPPTATARV